MKEWIYRRGYELKQTGYIPKWYEYILYFSIIDVLLFYKREYIDLINEKGEIRRVYIREKK